MMMETNESIDRLRWMQERLAEELEDREEHLAGQAANDDGVDEPGQLPTFQTIGHKHVDQAKLDRIRRGKEAGRAKKQEMIAEMEEWRQQFQRKIRGGKSFVIIPAGPELVMTK